ncbi:MAG TPA: PEP-CTERM sorting domain-containing protein [Bryobacteraceae bacterium]|nr:PEP-CTERM sorting domain-containing protein [Bryobacteraceae bacterium]
MVVSGNGTTGGCINWNGSTTCPTTGSGTYTVVAPSTTPFTDGTSGTIKNLNFNVGFPDTQFITYSSADGPVFFDLTDIRTNTTGSAIGDCTSNSQDVSCTPAGSIFTITNGPADPKTGLVDTVTVSLTTDLEGYVNGSGTNYNAANPYLGIFTTQAFSGSIASVLATIQSNGSISASWSASLGPQPVTVTPEPATSSLLVLGIGLIAVGVRRRSRRS